MSRITKFKVIPQLIVDGQAQGPLRSEEVEFVVTRYTKMTTTTSMTTEVDEDGNWYVFPSIQFDGENLKQFESNEEAMKNAMATGNFLKLPKEEALEYAEGGYKKGTPLETFDPIGQKAKTAQTFKEAVE